MCVWVVYVVLLGQIIFDSLPNKKNVSRSGYVLMSRHKVLVTLSWSENILKDLLRLIIVEERSFSRVDINGILPTNVFFVVLVLWLFTK